MDSLRIKNRRTWFRYSENRGGDAISFLERFEGKSFPEAVEYLLDYHGGARLLRAPPPVPEKKAVPFALPPPNSDNRRVTAYLQKRCIAPQVIRDFISAGLLYEDEQYIDFVFEHELHISPCPEVAAFKFAMSSKAVMPPDNTAQIFKKGIKEEPAPVTFPHRMGAQNRPRGLLLSCGMQDLTPPGKPAAQRVSSGRKNK